LLFVWDLAYPGYFHESIGLHILFHKIGFQTFDITAVNSKKLHNSGRRFDSLFLFIFESGAKMGHVICQTHQKGKIFAVVRIERIMMKSNRFGHSDR